MIKKHSLPAFLLVWYCVSQSWATGAWYYWYSYNFNYARGQAYNACVLYNGYTCSAPQCTLQ